ncbi:MAG TPA: cellulase family glycosylhydrolase [Marmoricola sp.]|nr:cellulase family glycosylhydrolase [Marmoricola sp.]
MSTRRIAWIGGLALAAAVVTSTLAPPLASSASAAGSRPVLGTPQAIRHSGRWLVDDQGRVLLPRGLNIVAKLAPYYPAAFSTTDAKFLSSEGFTTARIAFMWAGVEPRPGVYDDAYIKRIAHLNAVLASYGIRTLIDFHQDSYSEKYGGDGAPAWASLDNGLCLAPGAACTGFATLAFQNFWSNTQASDGIGIQDHFLRAWQHVLPFVRNSANVLGYDILNEPYPGPSALCIALTICPMFEGQQLATFYRRATAAIRSRDTTHLIFYEPMPTLLGNATWLPAPLSADAKLGYTYHFYARDCGLPPTPTDPLTVLVQHSHCAVEEGAAIDNGIQYARRANSALLMGEWGDTSNLVDVAQMGDLMNQRLVPWAEWEYNTTISSVAPGLLINDSKPGSERNARQDRLNALVSPYAPALAGTPLAYAYDRGRDVMTLTYLTRAASRWGLSRDALTELFIPRRHYLNGYHLRLLGARVVGKLGQYVYLKALPGAARVSVRLTR